MNNLSGNIEYSLQQYAAITQAQLLGTPPLRSQQQQRSDSQSSASQQATQGLAMQDPNAFNLAYQPFSLIRMVPPPQLHQPTLASSKELPASSITNIITTIDSPQKQLSQQNTAQLETVHSQPPTRVTRPPNAYLLFNKEMRRILKDQDPSMKVADISKEIGFRWKNLSKEQKEHYIVQANKLKDEQRALHPNAMYIRRSRAELVEAGRLTNRATSGKSNKHSSADQQTEKSSTRKRHPRRNRNASAPKHPLSAYMWYLTEVRPDTMRNFPGSNVGQISKLCADRWNNMTEEARLPWRTKAQADKERYAREMQIYAIQNDHTLGRGTRQKYRTAALKQANEATFIDPLLYKTMPQQQQQQLLLNHQSSPAVIASTSSSSSTPILLPLTLNKQTIPSEADSFLVDHPC